MSVTDATLSPDDRWLAYDSNETGEFEIYLQSFDRPTERRRVSPNGGGAPTWSRNGREILYVQPDGMLMAVPVSAPMETGAPIALFKMPLDPSRPGKQYSGAARGPTRRQRPLALAGAERRDAAHSLAGASRRIETCTPCRTRQHGPSRAVPICRTYVGSLASPAGDVTVSVLSPGGASSAPAALTPA